MSYWIEYQVRSFLLPTIDSGLAEARYVIAAEGGSSNLTERTHGRERRVREWYVAMLGTARQVMCQAVRAAADCEGAGLRLGSRMVTPEAYIARTRRLLRVARADLRRYVTLSAEVDEGHELVPLAGAAGYTLYTETRFGKTRVKLIPPAQDEAGWAAYFTLLDPFLDGGSVAPSRLGQVFGLAAS